MQARLVAVETPDDGALISADPPMPELPKKDNVAPNLN